MTRKRVPFDGIPDIVEFVTLRDYLGLVISPAQETLLRAIYGLPLSDEQLGIYQACTGRMTYAPAEGGYREVTVIAGRRSGKDSRIACPIALYEALYGEWWSLVTPGERVVIPLVAQNQDGTKTALDYIAAYAERPRISAFLDDGRTKSLQFRNVRADQADPDHPVRVTIECFPCSAKSLRGPAVPAGVLDEVAFFRVEGGLNADREVQRALKPAGLMFQGRQRLVKISSPYIQQGLLFEDYEKYWGKEHPRVLVWKASTAVMNPAADAATIESEREDDPESARMEYDADFNAERQTFLSLEVIDGATVAGRFQLPPVAGTRYVAAVDPSGGKLDAFALAIVHLEWRNSVPFFVQDVMKGWTPPKSGKIDLDATVEAIAGLLRAYGLYRVTGDAYAGDWPAQKFREHGIAYFLAEVDKSRAFVEFEPKIMTQTVELLDHPQLKRELVLLEKRSTPKGKVPAIGHPKGGHDDHPNALALAIAELAKDLHGVVGGTLESFQAARAARGDAPLAEPATAASREIGYDGFGRHARETAGRFWGRGGERTRLGMFR